MSAVFHKHFWNIWKIFDYPTELKWQFLYYHPSLTLSINEENKIKMILSRKHLHHIYSSSKVNRRDTTTNFLPYWKLSVCNKMKKGFVITHSLHSNQTSHSKNSFCHIPFITVTKMKLLVYKSHWHAHNNLKWFSSWCEIEIENEIFLIELMFTQELYMKSQNHGIEMILSSLNFYETLHITLEQACLK